jgi:hypothetical protein
MFADPQSVTINAVAKSLPAVSRGESASVYRASDELFSMRVSRQLVPKRERFLVELVQKKDNATPFQTTTISQLAKVQLITDIPTFGTAFTDTEVKYICAGLVDWLSGSSYANYLKVLGGET